jgi:hypothetical protein
MTYSALLIDSGEAAAAMPALEQTLAAAAG